MITLSLNGESKTIEANKNLLQAIDSWNLSAQQFAVAINEAFIPKSAYATTMLKEGDQIELLVPMQGG